MFRIQFRDAEGTNMFTIEIERTFTLSPFVPLHKGIINAIVAGLRERGWNFYAEMFSKVIPEMLNGTCLIITDLVHFNNAKYTFRV